MNAISNNLISKISDLPYFLIVDVVVQFYPWFKFYFLLFQTHYHTLPYPKTKENEISTKDKIEPQHRQS